MSGTTAILKLTQPAANSVPWDVAMNDNLSIIDAAVGKFFGVANLVGVWANSTAYTVGQVAIDDADSSMWSCLIAHTSAVAPTSFASDRAANPGNWLQAASTAQDYATQAQTFANNAAASASAAATSAAAVAGALPLSGGTVTGSITVNHRVMALTGQFADAAQTNGFYLSGTQRIFAFHATLGYYWNWDSASGNLTWVAANTSWFVLRTSDKLIYNSLAAVGGNGAYVNLSDERKKYDILPLDLGMDDLRRIRPIRFKREGKEIEEFGFGAQNVLGVAPQAVREFDKGYLGVSSDMILAIAVCAIQDLDSRIEALETNKWR